MSGADAGTRARSEPDACSVIWDEAQASALGTAAMATFWIALEQSGPWGREVATQSRLDPAVGMALDRQCRDEGGRLILIRRPGIQPKSPGRRPHRVYLAGGLAGRPWLLEADLDDPAQLLRLPWPAMRGGDVQLRGGEADPRDSDPNRDQGFDLGSDLGSDLIQESLPEFDLSPDPILMVCANSRRDICCAVRGRPVAIESSSQRPGQVWECSHTGGHRFAPTGILLPYGQALAHLTPTSAVAALDAAADGELPEELHGPAYDRGRSHLAPPAQAAESLVRQQIRECSLTALSTAAGPHPDQDSAWLCRVAHVDGRQWDVVAVRSSGGGDRPESCGKAAVPSWQWDCVVS